jgi:hypothetical protein
VGRPGGGLVCDRGLVGGDADEISLRSLGEHALKDIDDRVELHQVVAPGLREDRSGATKVQRSESS